MSKSRGVSGIRSVSEAFAFGVIYFVSKVDLLTFLKGMKTIPQDENGEITIDLGNQRYNFQGVILINGKKLSVPA